MHLRLFSGVIVLTVFGGYQSQKRGLFPFNLPLNGGDFDHGKIMRPVSGLSGGGGDGRRDGGGEGRAAGGKAEANAREGGGCGAASNEGRGGPRHAALAKQNRQAEPEPLDTGPVMASVSLWVLLKALGRGTGAVAAQAKRVLGARRGKPCAPAALTWTGRQVNMWLWVKTVLVPFWGS